MHVNMSLHVCSRRFLRNPRRITRAQSTVMNRIFPGNSVGSRHPVTVQSITRGRTHNLMSKPNSLNIIKEPMEGRSIQGVFKNSMGRSVYSVILFTEQLDLQ